MAQAQGGGGAPIRIDALSLQDLATLKNQLEQEFESFNNSLNSIHGIQGRYVESREALQATLKAENKGKKILVPMTSSLFVEGELQDSDKVLVDIGTGYYVEKKSKDAEEFLNRKIKLLEGEAERVQQLIVSRRKALEQVLQVMQMKIAQQQQQQGGTAVAP